MRVAGVPLWAIVLVACVAAPLLVRAWIDAEQRRAKRRTAEMLQGIAASRTPGASIHTETPPT